MQYLAFKNSGNFPQRGIDYAYLLDAHNMRTLSYRRQLCGAKFVCKLSSVQIDRNSSRFTPTFLPPFPRTNFLQGTPLVMMWRAVTIYFLIYLINYNRYY